MNLKSRTNSLRNKSRDQFGENNRLPGPNYHIKHLHNNYHLKNSAKLMSD